MAQVAVGWIGEVDFTWHRLNINVTLYRPGGLPGPAVYGFCASAGGGAAGVGAGGANTSALLIRPPRPTHRKHGLPSDRSVHINPDV